MYSVFSITPFLPKLSHSGGPWPVGSEEPLGLAIEKYLADTATVVRGSGLGGGKVCQCANVRAADRRANIIRYIVCIWRRRAAIALLVNKNHEQHVWSRFSHGFLALLSWLEHNFGAGFVGFLRFKKIHNYGLRNARELRSLFRSLGKKKPRDTQILFQRLQRSLPGIRLWYLKADATAAAPENRVQQKKKSENPRRN